ECAARNSDSLAATNPFAAKMAFFSRHFITKQSFGSSHFHSHLRSEMCSQPSLKNDPRHLRHYSVHTSGDCLAGRGDDFRWNLNTGPTESGFGDSSPTVNQVLNSNYRRVLQLKVHQQTVAFGSVTKRN